MLDLLTVFWTKGIASGTTKRGPVRRRALVAALGLVAGLTASPAPATDSSCAWPAQLDSTAFNVAYPDQFAHYWITALPAVEGAQLEIRGTFPWSRYMSFITYTERLEGIESLHDSQIVPDAGSSNPFLPGASRLAEARSYRVRVVFGPEASTQPNTVYTAKGSKVARSFIVAYRVFRADKRFADVYDRTGGPGLPDLTMVLPGGTRVDIPRCTIPGAPPNDLNEQVANASLPGPGSPLGGGFNPPRWRKFYNLPDSVLTATENPRTESAALSEALRPYAQMLPKGGFIDNPDNNYITTFINHFSFGPLVVIKGKLPTTPNTYDNAATMGSGQLRYWSLCTNHAPTQRYYACLADDQVDTNPDGTYTIVISTFVNRPTTAPVKFNWLAGGPTNDKVLILRNMLPDGFPNAIQHAGYSPAEVEATMREYFPTTCYSDVATFAATGGCTPATAVASAASHRGIHDDMECGNLHLVRRNWV
jgi:hypothetical protein